MSKRRHRNFEVKNDSDGEEESQMNQIFGHKRRGYFALVAAAFFVLGFFVNMQTGLTGYFVQSDQNQNAITPQEAGELAMDVINNRLIPEGSTAKLVKVEEESGLYKIITSYQGNQIPVYMTKDGKYLIQGVVEISKIPKRQNTQRVETQNAEVPKSDRPKVNLFVMSYCPYGLQMEKAFIPVMKLLGSKADIEINFVYYAMHGKKEIDENTRQYCIQKEQSDKFVNYLECFVQSGNVTKCILEAGIDETALQSCIENTDKEFNITGLYNDKSTWVGGFPLYPIDAQLNSKYGVGGSPTLVINNVRLAPLREDCTTADEQAGKCIIYPVERSPEAVKKVICSAFRNPPEECNQTLSSSWESPGFGPLGQGGTVTASGGGCGR